MARTLLFPNRNTIGLCAILFAMWYAGASQANGAAYLLGFILGSIALVSSLHCWANVRAVTLRVDPVNPVFAGEMISLNVTAETQGKGARPGLQVRKDSTAVGFEIISTERPQSVEIRFVAEVRGCFPNIPLRIASLYPLGFFTATRCHHSNQLYYVYPKAEGVLPLPRSHIPNKQIREGLKGEGDDFAGTRAYQTGESQRHIDWKAVARGQPLLVKQWSSDADETLHFNWHDLLSMGWEERLCQLARWIVVAQLQGASYGLHLPWETIAPGRDEAHFHKTLRALAIAPRAPQSEEISR